MLIGLTRDDTIETPIVDNDELMFAAAVLAEVLKSVKLETEFITDDVITAIDEDAVVPKDDKFNKTTVIPTAIALKAEADIFVRPKAISYRFQPRTNRLNALLFVQHLWQPLLNLPPYQLNLNL